MSRLSLSPDPVDFQIIRTSNCLQLLSCCCHAISCVLSLSLGGEVGESARCAAFGTQVLADCFTASVGGCMCVQVNKEMDEHCRTAGEVKGGGEGKEGMRKEIMDR
ncbi:hypothetical protein TrRE_jg9744 [Triparma retinervis]|uniref:Uncharacterized protein n=1 Tax=Triparma retinervis TaxID=2557542 RepID=A0A9W7CHD4_9STRA|nr:hypothetical protein TrRE_jg9744 [Triparma retinervis]